MSPTPSSTPRDRPIPRSLGRQRLRWKHGRLLTFNKYRNLFGSLDPRHSRFLTLLIMPAALYAEIILFFEPVLILLFLAYTVLSSDFVPLAIFATMLTLVVWLQVLSDVRRAEHWNLLLLAPVAWLLFCWLELVEYRALLGSLARMATGRQVEWQRWQRRGVFGSGAPGDHGQGQVGGATVG